MQNVRSGVCYQLTIRIVNIAVLVSPTWNLRLMPPCFREEYARQFGFMGEHLVEELGKGHHSGDVANLPPQFSPQPQYSRNVRQKRRLRRTQGQVLLNLALSVFNTK